MNSQNRMNAGAEYVLYRIWATLQDHDGIHAASLLACMGALAGYACQVYARRAGAGAREGAGIRAAAGGHEGAGVRTAASACEGARVSAASGAREGAEVRAAAGAYRGAGVRAAAAGGIDIRKLALTPTTAGHGCTYIDGHALAVPLISSPLSVWALVRRSLQKLHAPLPDIEDISVHITRTLGTSEFGMPRVGEEHRPRALPIVYLAQLWPQILPIAQRFCRRPAQLPVLFGIALQRAIENTTARLNPTLAASIAMECAIAMSKVTFPASSSDLLDLPQSGTRASKTRRPVALDSKGVEAGAFRLRMRSAKISAAIMSLAILAITSIQWQREPEAETPAVARLATRLRAPESSAGANNRTFDLPPSPEQPAQQVPVDIEEPIPEETPAAQDVLQSSPDDAELPAPTPDMGEGVIAEEWQSA